MVLVPFLITLLLGKYVDKYWLVFGYVCCGLHFFLFGMATSTQFVYFILPLLLFCGPLTPRTRAIISNSSSPEHQAKILSAFSAVQSLATFVAPGFSAGYSFTVFSCPGCMYIVFACMLFVSALLIAICICVPSINRVLYIIQNEKGNGSMLPTLKIESTASPLSDEEIKQNQVIAATSAEGVFLVESAISMPKSRQNSVSVSVAT